MGKIKTIQIHVTDDIYHKLKKRKGKKPWDDFILEVADK